MDYEISNYLERTVRGKGTCRTCNRVVSWNREKLGAHKRANCIGVTEQEKQLFRLHKAPAANLNNSDVSMHSEDDDQANAPYVLTNEKKTEIDAALAKLFFRTGIPFKVADADSFREFVKLLNPAYAEVMPKSQTVSGRLLDKEYTSSFDKLTNILKDCNDLTLISDGWTNVRGDHIVNFLVKAPGHPSMFFKSLDTSGIPQTTAGVTAAITGVIQEIGEEKVTALVTDNAAVMKSSWVEIEEAYPMISAYGCSAHALNLLVKDILVPYKDGKKVSISFCNHSK